MTSTILFILAGAFLIWQLSLVAMAVGLMSNGRAGNVRIGVGPGLAAVILAIIGVVLL